MGLDIDVDNPVTGEHLEMNWLRNPYGLERWARANYLFIIRVTDEPTPNLWDVCNQWSYAKSAEVDRPAFLQTVLAYGDVISTLERGYFWFDETMFIQFISPHKSVLPMKDGQIEDSVSYVLWELPSIGIPMEHLSHPRFGLSDRIRPNAHTLARYKEWYRQLIDIAELLQKPDSVFYCSN